MSIAAVILTSMIWIERCVLPTVCVAPEVSHPDIIAIISQDEPQGLAVVLDHKVC